jgi:hypothetical protein
MQGSMPTSLAVYALAFFPTARPLFPVPLYKLAKNFLIIYSFPSPKTLSNLANVFTPPTRTVRDFEQIIDKNVTCPNAIPDYLYLCVLGFLFFSAGVRLVFCRSQKDLFFSSEFMIYVGFVAKIFQFVATQSGTYYNYSAVALTLFRPVFGMQINPPYAFKLLRVNIESTLHHPPTTAALLHYLTMITESSLLFPLDTLHVVATVLSCSICSAIANMIFSTPQCSPVLFPRYSLLLFSSSSTASLRIVHDQVPPYPLILHNLPHCQDVLGRLTLPDQVHRPFQSPLLFRRHPGIMGHLQRIQ